jgi:hypothetical protein
MTKELLTIEFRYHDVPKFDGDESYRSKTITIGIFDTLEKAIEEGNKCIDILSKTFEVRKDDKFQLNYLFGRPNKLVTNCCYPTNGIQYFAKITTLTYDDINEMVSETFKSLDRYKEYKLNNETE